MACQTCICGECHNECYCPSCGRHYSFGVSDENFDDVEFEDNQEGEE